MSENRCSECGGPPAVEGGRPFHEDGCPQIPVSEGADVIDLDEYRARRVAYLCICERRARENTDEDCPTHGQDGGWPLPERPVEEPA